MESLDKVYERLMSYALFLLGRRRFTSQEMEDRLKKRMKKLEIEEELAKKTINKVIVRLIELNLINDESYVKDFIESRMEIRPRGIMGLKYELKKKGIKLSDIEKYFSENEIDEESFALKLAEQKLSHMARISEEKKRSKIIMFLSSRGFKSQTIYDIIEKIFNQ